MSRALFTSNGVPVVVGRELGRGGEGSVNELPALAGQVAKLYHKIPDPKKQAKLSFMASTVDARLLNYVAWPQETLHSSRGGPVVGFLMPKVTGKAPIHTVYSPAHRRHHYPTSAWDFLLFVARNVAASFETVHAHGHVIGDVNQNSFMVGRDSKVLLIDSDSFQICARGTHHLCEVGVSHFTPPELQGLASFDGFVRSKNHDNFGLALLVFHLLFGGRHPFSGVPLRNDVDSALETEIMNFRYAYARDCQSRGIQPPPRSIPVSMIPDSMESMLHFAFTERGSGAGRPTAQQWVAALDNLRANLRKCNTSGMHVYPNHLGHCPWCALEHKGIVYFLDVGAAIATTSNGFVIAQVWARIQAVPPPSSVNVPSPSAYPVTAQARPFGIPGKALIAFYKLLAASIAVTLFVVNPKIWFIWLIVGWVGWAMAADAGSSRRAVVRKKREDELQAAKQEYDVLVERARREAGSEGFNGRKAQLSKVREELEMLPITQKNELEKLLSTVRERQKQKFLDTCFIDSATISGVGAARKAALRSFGIETAADVKKSDLMQVRGFGEGLTRAVLDWKGSCERRFVFNPAAGVSVADRNAVQAKFLTKRIMLEKTLASGPTELEECRQKASAQFASLSPRLEFAAKRVAQAQADLTVI